METKNLTLVPCDPQILKSAIEGNVALSNKLEVTVPDNWTEFGVPALQYALDMLAESEEERGWWTYFPVHRQDNTLIGSGGYKGRPTAEGTVELGYEIAPGYRSRGFATELTMGLVDNAFGDPRVRSIIAHTLGHTNPSTKVLAKCGFIKVAEMYDPEEGTIWKWELKRPG